MKVMLAALSALTLSSCATHGVTFRDSLLVGRLQSVQLKPKGATPNINGDILEISNSCGIATTQFSTITAISGKPQAKYSFDTSLDEWCSVPFNLSTDQYLIHIRENGRNSELVFAEPIESTNDGRLLIVPNQRLLFGEIDLNQYRSPVAIGDFPVDVRGVRGADLEILISRGYVKDSDGVLFYTSVVYIDQLPPGK